MKQLHLCLCLSDRQPSHRITIVDTQTIYSFRFPHSEKEFLSIDTLQSRYAYFAGLLPWLCTSAP